MSMIYYLNTKTGEFPVLVSDIQKVYASWEPSQALPSPWVQVDVPERPTEYKEAQFDITLGSPTLINGAWNSLWVLKEKSPKKVFEFKQAQVKTKIMQGNLLSPEEASLLIDPSYLPAVDTQLRTLLDPLPSHVQKITNQQGDVEVGS